MATDQGEEDETGLSVEQGGEASLEVGAAAKTDNNNEEVQHDEVEHEASSEQTKPKINTKNWLNLAAYVLNIVFTFGVGTNGWFGNGTNSELSLKYQVR